MNWPDLTGAWRIVRSAVLAFAVTLGAGAASVRAQTAPPPAAEVPEQFPDFQHREETFLFCSACHAFQLVGRQGMSKERWDSTLDWMVEKHNMPRLEGAERGKVLDYLASAFPERPQSGWKSPFTP